MEYNGLTFSMQIIGHQWSAIADVLIVQLAFHERGPCKLQLQSIKDSCLSPAYPDLSRAETSNKEP